MSGCPKLQVNNNNFPKGETTVTTSGTGTTATTTSGTGTTTEPRGCQ